MCFVPFCGYINRWPTNKVNETKATLNGEPRTYERLQKRITGRVEARNPYNARFGKKVFDTIFGR